MEQSPERRTGVAASRERRRWLDEEGETVTETAATLRDEATRDCSTASSAPDAFGRLKPAAGRVGPELIAAQRFQESHRPCASALGAREGPLRREIRACRDIRADEINSHAAEGGRGGGRKGSDDALGGEACGGNVPDGYGLSGWIGG